MKFRCLVTWALILSLAGQTQVVMALESVRTQEIRECRIGEIATWNDGQDRAAIGSELNFAYNPTHAPHRFPEPVVADMVSKAAIAWSQCGVPSKMVSRAEAASRARDIVWVQWDEPESRGNFGLANLARRTISLSPKAFDLLNARNPTYDAKITLQMTISHEMGHLYGLMAHSRRCVDVLSYYHNGKGDKCYKRSLQEAASPVEYRHTFPTACDIERCKKSNGL